VRRISFRMGSIFFVLLAIGSGVLAQTSKGFLVGNVFDPTGAVIVGANVKLTNSSTGTTRETVSASDGSFRIDAVDPGTYQVEVSQVGFKTVLRDNVVVGASQTTTLSFQLEVGTQSEVVNV